MRKEAYISLLVLVFGLLGQISTASAISITSDEPTTLVKTLSPTESYSTTTLYADTQPNSTVATTSTIPIATASFDTPVTPLVTASFDAPTTPVEKIPSSPSPSTATQLYTNGSPSNSIRLSWKDTSNETRYTIYRSSTNGTNPSLEFPIIAANITSYDDLNLSSGTYSYYISACNTIGCSFSAITNPITIAVPAITDIISNTNEDNSSKEISNALGKAVVASFISVVPEQTTTLLSKPFTATVSNDGSFSIKVPDGIYTVEGFQSSNNPGVKPIVKKITILGGKVTTITDQVNTSTKKIRGTILFPDGTPVNDVEINAYKKETGEWLSARTNANGTYSMDASAGVWSVSIRPINETTAQWMSDTMNLSAIFTNQNTDETQDLTITVKPLTSNISLTVTDELGNPLTDIGVIIDTISSQEPLQTSPANVIRKIITEKTKTNGSFTSKITPGIYFIRTSVPNTSLYGTPTEVKITIGNNETKTITIVLKKKNTLTTIAVKGVTKFDDDKVTEAFVSAWSKEGGSEQVKTSVNGAFTLTLAINQTWHIQASKDVSQKSYISDEQTIIPTLTNNSLDLVFAKSKSIPLPPVVSSKKEATEQVILSTDDGTRFSLPANTVTSYGKIDIEIKPTVEAASHSASSLVSAAYDITIKDVTGQKLSKLAGEAEILLPYNEKGLVAKGVILENVIPSYYDESIGAWISVPKFTINKDKKVFVLHVNHLTRFALIAATDTTAPASPTSVITDAITPTDVKLSWKNPSQDFDHSKIYRSEKLGSFGKVIAAEVFSNSFVDTTYSINGITYYYTVRSVDAAGNESTNNKQLAFTPVRNQFAQTKKTVSLLLPPGQASSGQITRMLTLGSKGLDVTSLQTALKLDGFYATGPITGYYGKLTENAVYRFQNYYKNELLIPHGYKTGTGVVGAITRNKINEILAKGLQ